MGTLYPEIADFRSLFQLLSNKGSSTAFYANARQPDQHDGSHPCPVQVQSDSFPLILPVPFKVLSLPHLFLTTQHVVFPSPLLSTSLILLLIIKYC
jgi:hypothetical protein